MICTTGCSVWDSINDELLFPRNSIVLLLTNHAMIITQMLYPHLFHPNSSMLQYYFYDYESCECALE